MFTNSLIFDYPHNEVESCSSLTDNSGTMDVNPANRIGVECDRLLRSYFYQFPELIVDRLRITNDLCIWFRSNEEGKTVSYQGKEYRLYAMARFVLKLKYDELHRQPYLLVVNRPSSFIFNVTLQQLIDNHPGAPFVQGERLSPSMITRVLTLETRLDHQGSQKYRKRIEHLRWLHENQIDYDPTQTYPFLNRSLKQLFGLQETPTFESPYIKYLERISGFNAHYLQTDELRKILPNLARDFTRVDPEQLKQVDPVKRKLVFKGGFVTDRPRHGILRGPIRECLNPNVRIFAIFHEDDKALASDLMYYFRLGSYEQGEHGLAHFVGSNVTFAPVVIQFKNRANPVPEIAEQLKTDAFVNLDANAIYVGIYLLPIQKHEDSPVALSCYYQVKELFLNHDIALQCVDAKRMRMTIEQDKRSKNGYKNFTYWLQNMSVAICAKVGGVPWRLNEKEREELVIGIGAYRTGNRHYLGTAFSFNNQGVFHQYDCFERGELTEVVECIRQAIWDFKQQFASPRRIIIHYYKLMNHRYEFKLIEQMLQSLALDVPVYVVTINKTESEDVVLFDETSKYQNAKKEWVKGYLPYSGTWLCLGRKGGRHSYLLCNNTRYSTESFRWMDGFPFPIKLTISCPNHPDSLDDETVDMLIGQVYQFSRLYWKSVKHQCLPVTIKYPEMIAQFLSHFEDPIAYGSVTKLFFL